MGRDISQTTCTTYNDAGQVSSLMYPDGETVTSQFDGNGYLRLVYGGTASSTDPVNFLASQIGYTNDGLLSSMAIGGSASKTSTPTPVFTISIGYDGIQRAVSTQATRNGTTFWNQTRTYDNVGNVLSLNTILPTTSGSTQTEMQSFCYDALNCLVWSGNTGTPTGGDHCGLNPTGTTISTYQQSYSYDALDRLTNGSQGTQSYGSFPVHGVTGLSNVLGQYASYDAMGNMTTSDTITFDNYTDLTYSGGVLSTTKYYTVGVQKIAMSKDGVLSYLLNGSADTVQNNAFGMDPFAYVGIVMLNPLGRIVH
jgi:hypothetical protein